MIREARRPFSFLVHDNTLSIGMFTLFDKIMEFPALQLTSYIISFRLVQLVNESKYSPAEFIVIFTC
jgi:hypothetical protein